MNALVKREEKQSLSPALSLEDLKERAALVVHAGLAPRGMTPEQLTITMLKGQEMGMGPMEAMESFYVVNGAVGSMTHQLVSRLRAAGHDYTINESTTERCVVTIYRSNGARYTHTLTFKECEDAGYNKGRDGIKATWRGAGQRWMLAYRTISSAIKTFCPEVLHRSYRDPDASSGRPGATPAEPDLASSWYAYTRQLLASLALDEVLDLVRQVAASRADESDDAEGNYIEGDYVEGEHNEVDDSDAQESLPPQTPPTPPTPLQAGPTPLISRPYPPEMLKRGIASRVAKYSPEQAAPRVRGATVGAVEALFLGKDKVSKTAMRHTVTEYLLAKHSSTDWTHGECQALLDWAQTRNDQGELDPNPLAAQEAEAIVLFAGGAAGQQELPL